MPVRTAITVLITLALVGGLVLLLPSRDTVPVRRPAKPARPRAKPSWTVDLQADVPRLARGALHAFRTTVRRFKLGLVRQARLRALARGWREFRAEIPEDIPFRDYDYIRRVEDAIRKRWFSPEERPAYEAAVADFEETQKHRHRLISDHLFRAADSARARLAHDPLFKDYVYATRWAPPFLICYSSGERIPKQDLLFHLDDKETLAKRAAVLKERERLDRRLEGKSRLFPQLYKEFLQRFGKRLRLRDLTDEFGGRADLPTGTRSFHEGAPLVVWIFETHEAFHRHHRKVARRPISFWTLGYFSSAMGWVVTHDRGDDPDDRVAEIHGHLALVTHQLEHWFSRQRGRWRRPQVAQTFFGQGLSRWMAGVTVSQDWRVTFAGWNGDLLRGLQEDLGPHGYRLFSLKALVAMSSYSEAEKYGVMEWAVHPSDAWHMFTQQAYALVLFLNQHPDPRYRQGFLRFFDRVLDGQSWQHATDWFAEAFRLRDDDDWEALERAWHAYMRDDLMKRDLSKYAWEPPPRPK